MNDDPFFSSAVEAAHKAQQTAHDSVEWVGVAELWLDISILAHAREAERALKPRLRLWVTEDVVEFGGGRVDLCRLSGGSTVIVLQNALTWEIRNPDGTYHASGRRGEEGSEERKMRILRSLYSLPEDD